MDRWTMTGQETLKAPLLGGLPDVAAPSLSEKTLNTPTNRTIRRDGATITPDVEMSSSKHADRSGDDSPDKARTPDCHQTMAIPRKLSIYLRKMSSRWVFFYVF